ncbi:hypothetical protein [Streptomyces sp. NPDC047046]|uniref:SCO2584 family spore wall biosynthesis protein n=1 Tax=Streptomyces sp. NPDC047046 TaxID=3155378 RepID=UPI0033EE701F
MPEDVGGAPFADGWEPDDDHDHGRADEEFAAVVFDEDFVRAARVHEPSAVERLLAAAEARAEAEANGRGGRRLGEERGDPSGAYDPLADWGGGEEYDEYRDARALEHRGRIRWHRPVAWMLALVLGVGMVALALSAVYRGASGTGDDPLAPPPTSAGSERGANAAEPPTASPDHSRPVVQATPRTP